MPAGGTWTAQNKVRPGAYINYKAVPKPSGGLGQRGVVAVGLPMTWGAEDSVIELTSEELATGKSLAKIGYDTTDIEPSLPYRLALTGSFKALFFRTDVGGEKAKATVEENVLSLEAKYAGTTGNGISVVITKDKPVIGKYQIDVLMDGVRQESFQVLNMDEVAQLESKYVKFVVANAPIGELTITSAPGTKDFATVITVSPAVTAGNTLYYKVGKTVTIPAYGDIIDLTDGYYAYVAGAEIESMTTGDEILVVEVTTKGEAVKAGKTKINANDPVINMLTVTSALAATPAANKTKLTVSPAKVAGNTYVVAAGGTKPKYGDTVKAATGVTIADDLTVTGVTHGTAYTLVELKGGKAYGYGAFTANTTALGTLTLTPAAGSAAGKFKVTISPEITSGNAYYYKVTDKLPTLDAILDATWVAYTAGADITAASGTKVAIVEADAAKKAKKGAVTASNAAAARMAMRAGAMVGGRALPNTNPIPETAGTVLAGGTNGTVDAKALPEKLKLLKLKDWQCLAVRGTDVDTRTAVEEFITQCREKAGKRVQGVVYDHSEADYEGIISVDQGFVTDVDTVGVDLFPIYVASMTAGAQVYESNTSRVVEDAVSIINPIDEDLIEDALLSGKFILTYRQDAKVVMEKDINTLHTFTADKSYAFSKNRVTRTLDDIGNFTTLTFNQNFSGKESNNDVGRNLFKSQIISHIDALQDVGAVKDFDGAEDITVLPGIDIDAVTCDLYVKPVDSMEKLYMVINVDA